jgi:hypothetical protein
MKRLIGAAMLCAAATVPAMAGTFTLTIDNPWGFPIKSIRVKGGEASRPPAVRNQERKFSITVTLPDGLCYTRVSLFFENGHRSDVMGDLCSVQEIVID